MLRRGLIDAYPQSDRFQFDEGEEVHRELVIASANPSAVLDAFEEPFHLIAVAV